LEIGEVTMAYCELRHLLLSVGSLQRGFQEMDVNAHRSLPRHPTGDEEQGIFFAKVLVVMAAAQTFHYMIEQGLE